MGGQQHEPFTMTSPTPRPWLAWLYLALAVAGGILPWLANLDYMRQYGSSFDLGLFVELANANPAAQSLSRDLLVGATAVTVWIVVESRRLQMRRTPELVFSLDRGLERGTGVLSLLNRLEQERQGKGEPAEAGGGQGD